MPRSSIDRGKFAAQTLANGLIASARNLTADAKGRPAKVIRSQWELAGWNAYDTIEVFHYGVQWVGNILSRAKLTLLENGKESTNPEALAVLDAFFGGSDQQGEFLRQSGIHMTVAGEGYILGVEGSDGDIWRTPAAVEVRGDGISSYTIEGEKYDPADILLIRYWRPHPRKYNLSDSPTRSLLPILSQIDELTKYVSAQADSRLSSAGVLLVPNEITFPSQQADANGVVSQANAATAFLKELAETMAAAKANPQSAASRVPAMLQGPGDQLEKVRLLTFWTELDEAVGGLRDEAIRRLALGMDMPPEALLGTGDVNHWGAWQIEDALINSHIEPLLALIVDAVTIGYLRVVLIESGMDAETAKTFKVGTDTSTMRLRPDRSKEAGELWDRGALSDQTLRRENGFDETDAPSKDETTLWLAKKIAQGSPAPDQVAAAAKMFGVNLPTGDAPTTELPGGQAPLPRSLEEHPTRSIPDTQDASALVAMSEVALFAALSRAGNRIKSTAAKIEGIPQGVPSMDRYLYVKLSKSQLDFVLEDAWPILSRITPPEGISIETVETALDNYARLLITNQQPHDRGILARYLAQAVKSQ